MEIPCYKCGARVEEGARVCPSCGAPQIRVSSPATPEAPAAISQGPDIHQPFAVPLAAAAPSAQLSWRHALPTAALGGLVGAVLCLLPLISLGFPIWMFLTGIFAVTFYRRRGLGYLTSGAGARLGLLAGAIGFAIFAVFFSVQYMLSVRTGVMRQVYDRMAQNNPDPQVQQFMQWAQTSQGVIAIGAIILALALLGFVLLGALGGAVRGKPARPGA